MNIFLIVTGIVVESFKQRKESNQGSIWRTWNISLVSKSCWAHWTGPDSGKLRLCSHFIISILKSLVIHCNLIGSQQCDLLTNHTIFCSESHLLYIVSFLFQVQNVIQRHIPISLLQGSTPPPKGALCSMCVSDLFQFCAIAVRTIQLLVSAWKTMRYSMNIALTSLEYFGMVEHFQYFGNLQFDIFLHFSF